MFVISNQLYGGFVYIVLHCRYVYYYRYFAHEAFADVTKVETLRGVYIANQQTNATFNLENQRSVITFDKGGEWQPLSSPEKDLDGNLSNCSKVCIL